MSKALLATLKAVFVDGSGPIVSRPAVQTITLAQYTAGHIWLECVNSDGSNHNLASDTILGGVRLHPTDADPAIAFQFENMDEDPDGNPANHWARAELIPGHWLEVPPKIYGYNVIAIVDGDVDDRMVVVPYSQWKTTGENVHPGDDIEVPESTQPIGTGPAGPAPTPSSEVGTFDVVIFNGVLRTRQHERVVVSFTGASETESVTWPDFEGRPFYAHISNVRTDDIEVTEAWLVESTVGDTGGDVMVNSADFVGDVVIDLLEVLS